MQSSSINLLKNASSIRVTWKVKRTACSSTQMRKSRTCFKPLNTLGVSCLSDAKSRLPMPGQEEGFSTVYIKKHLMNCTFF